MKPDIEHQLIGGASGDYQQAHEVTEPLQIFTVKQEVSAKCPEL